MSFLSFIALNSRFSWARWAALLVSVVVDDIVTIVGVGER